VLVRVVDFAGVTAEALRHEGLWSVKMRGLQQVERYVIVGGSAWMGEIARWFAPFTRIRTRHFALSAEAAAWDWLEANPVEQRA